MWHAAGVKHLETEPNSCQLWNVDAKCHSVYTPIACHLVPSFSYKPLVCRLCCSAGAYLAAEACKPVGLKMFRLGRKCMAWMFELIRADADTAVVGVSGNGRCRGLLPYVAPALAKSLYLASKTLP
jgi:hypothetical protein